MSNYGDKIKLEDNLKVDLPDFSVEYLGNEVVPEPPGRAAKTRRIHQFRIVKDNEEQVIQWSSIGLIAPRKFQVNGKDYSLVIDIPGNLVVGEGMMLHF